MHDAPLDWIAYGIIAAGAIAYALRAGRLARKFWRELSRSEPVTLRIRKPAEKPKRSRPLDSRARRMRAMMAQRSGPAGSGRGNENR